MCALVCQTQPPITITAPLTTQPLLVCPPAAGLSMCAASLSLPAASLERRRGRVSGAPGAWLAVALLASLPACLPALCLSRQPLNLPALPPSHALPSPPPLCRHRAGQCGGVPGGHLWEAHGRHLGGARSCSCSCSCCCDSRCAPCLQRCSTHCSLQWIRGSRRAPSPPACLPACLQVGLLAAGQSSTMTGTYTGQFVMGGFLNLKVAAAGTAAGTAVHAIMLQELLQALLVRSTCAAACPGCHL